MPLNGVAVAAPEASEVSGYVPDRRAEQYLEAILHLLGEGGRLSDERVGDRMVPKMKADALRKWRTRHPDALAWAWREIERSVDRDKPLVLRRAVDLALRGSIDHANFLAKVGGWFKQPEGGGGAAAGVSNEIHLHFGAPTGGL